jgi:hypothetical protein
MFAVQYVLFVYRGRHRDQHTSTLKISLIIEPSIGVSSVRSAGEQKELLGSGLLRRGAIIKESAYKKRESVQQTHIPVPNIRIIMVSNGLANALS